MLKYFAANVEGEVFGINDPADKAQPCGHKLLVVIGDKNPLNVELYTGLVIHLIQIEGGFFRYEKERGIFQGSLGFCVNIKERFLHVVANLLVELPVVFFFEVGF